MSRDKRKGPGKAAGLLYKEKRMSREDDFDDIMDSPEDNNGQDDSPVVEDESADESYLDETEELETVTPAITEPVGAPPPPPRRKPAPKKKKKVVAKPKPKVKKKAVKPARKPASKPARKPAAKKTAKTTAKKKTRPAAKKKKTAGKTKRKR